MGTGHLFGGWATADGFQRAQRFFGPRFVFDVLAAGVGMGLGLLFAHRGASVGRRVVAGRR